jgi:hypothetical protein
VERRRPFRIGEDRPASVSGTDHCELADVNPPARHGQTDERQVWECERGPSSCASRVSLGRRRAAAS